MEPELYYLYATAAFLFGLCFGSFLNVCIYRLPLGMSVVRPRSACPKCGHAIAGYDNIPVLSWLILRGRCRGCKEPFSARYMLVELATGLLWLLCFLHFGATLETVKYCVLTFLLLGLIFTDYDHHLLPDKMTIPGFWIGLGFSIVVPVGGLLSRYCRDAGWVNAVPAVGWVVLWLGDALIGAVVGAGFVWGAGELYKRLRGVEGMGFGDVKLMAMVGVFLGAKLTLLVLFGASLLGGVAGMFVVLVVFSKRLRRYGAPQLRRAWNSASLAMRFYEMPFGVFLGGVAMLVIFYGGEFLRWYLGRF